MRLVPSDGSPYVSAIPLAPLPLCFTSPSAADVQTFFISGEPTRTHLTHRPAVDVVVPFVGSDAELDELAATLARLATREGDSLTIADNRPSAAKGQRGRVAVVAAPERQSSYHARNRGAEGGRAEWILFLDADVTPSADLLDRYFETPPGERVAVLAGGVVDEPLEAGKRHPAAARYAMLRAHMGQHNTLRDDSWGYAQTANCAVRRSALEDVGGFCDHVRSGGDADLCFRLRRAGWDIEERAEAAVIHVSRRSLRKLLRQRARHGAGAAWLSREYPGAFPRTPVRDLCIWTVRSEGRALAAAARRRGDEAIVSAIDPISLWAYELGRLLPNERRA